MALALHCAGDFMLSTQRFSIFIVVFALMLIANSASASGRKKDFHSVPVPLARVYAFKADLDGAVALPSNSEPASGDVAGTYDPETHVLRFNARFLNLSGPATNAKFFSAAAIDRVGLATVAAPRPDARLVTGTAWLDQEEEQELLAGRWYFNVTTEKHPQGEIRGAIRLVNKTND
ncbi:CHRD domain-containing protein [Terriglobus sp. ADX1]|uniref:CHRD domain-containing protein n=1 Tax=Terriglobus sp. ADX1 TaxID=2794063 RepID=UPI002FE57908